MMVASSLDLWRKDALFSAAEEVQESADVMESTYGMWVKQKREGMKPEDLDELSRELQTALGTAKWQLEEFERAVRLSHGHHCDDITSSIHKQFIAAIESQISRVEMALRESFSEEGKQPLRWVDLNKEECDDLAMFLSGISHNLQLEKDDCTTQMPAKKNPFRDNIVRRKDAADIKTNGSFSTDISSERSVNDVASSKGCEVIIDIKEETLVKKDDVAFHSDKTTGTRRICNSQNFGALKIITADEDTQKNKLLPIIEATPKEKGFKPLFWKQRCGEHSQTNGGKIAFNQLFGYVGGFQRQLQAPLHLQFSCSIQLILALMLSIFLIGKFLICLNCIYSFVEKVNGYKCSHPSTLVPCFT
uniref:Uncharacterized protein LOC105139289 isoform X1 n=1 Tax=Rhizophora mucronata TaxID=61149 RepID=A0A2P2M7T9_RHIMU